MLSAIRSSSSVMGPLKKEMASHPPVATQAITSVDVTVPVTIMQCNIAHHQSIFMFVVDAFLK